MIGQFRVTYGVAAPLATPKVRVGTVERFGKGMLVWRLHDVSGDVPHELAIRELLRLDPRDEDAALEFALTYGAITEHWMASPTDLGRVIDSAFPLIEFDEDTKSIEDRWRLLRRERTANGVATLANTVTDVAWHLRLLQIMVDHWRLHSEGGHIAEAWTSLPMTVPDEALWTMWVAYMRRLVPPPSAALRVDREGEEIVGAEVAQLHEALAVQLFNIGVEGHPLRRCGECSRYFVRKLNTKGEPSQQARLAKDSVKYCSDPCKNRATQRRLRSGGSK